MTAAPSAAYSVAGSGPALILIHGIGAGRATFDALVAGLAGQFTCVTYDLRGHGLTPWPGGAVQLDDLVDDLEALRLRLGLKTAHIAGHALGGMVAARYALRHPDRVQSLGLWSTPAFRSDEDRAKARAVLAQMRNDGIGPVLKLLAPRWFTETTCATRPGLIAWRKAQVLATPPEVFLQAFDLYANYEMAPWFSQLTSPVQIITGALDAGSGPQFAERMQAALPGSDLVILPGQKHAMLIEASEQVLPPLRRFLTAKG